MKRNKNDSKAYEDYLNFEDSQQWDPSEAYPEDEVAETLHENYTDWEHQGREDVLEDLEDTFNTNTGKYRSRREYQRHLQDNSLNTQEYGELELQNQSSIEEETITTAEPKLQRAKYSAKVDRFLTNGIIVVTVLLIAVLLIAFLV